ncbi:hypothetical protein [Streptomyces turgidiscabies]|uniref:Lipoprotein n=1 Tax=Streptomyces turgidiscabies TaxID=85558 RepID=A0ABU0RNG1_9ACTN|nr:hypothetical protein [Streptomyces turgidiscabies]MDQ0933533.1 hypothetical protein [Streptomyces turgidiscabies]
MSAVIVLLAAADAGAAASDDEPVPAGDAKVVLNDGTAVGVDDEFEFAFTDDEAPVKTPQVIAACPEVNDPPTYTVKGTPYFLPDDGKPQSTWLLPRQSVSWTVTGSHTFTLDVSGGYEAEGKIIVAKAKVKVDVKIGNSWTWTGTQTVTDTNSTNKGYRAVLGQVGWKLTSVKTWIAPPCNVKRKTIVVKAPRAGDMSIGRQNS